MRFCNTASEAGARAEVVVASGTGARAASGARARARIAPEAGVMMVVMPVDVDVVEATVDVGSHDS